jgi:flagellar motility protein MotE (MotC chaperone)
VSGTLDDLALMFLSQHPGPAAAVLEQVEADEVAQSLLPLDVRRASLVLMRMNVDAAARALRCLVDSWARDTLVAADAVQAARWLAHLDDEASARLLAG